MLINRNVKPETVVRKNEETFNSKKKATVGERREALRTLCGRAYFHYTSLHIWRIRTSPPAHYNLLAEISAWCSTWLMILSLCKTKTMSFTNRSSPITTSHFINNNAVQVTATYAHLGINFQPDLKWHYHISLTLVSASCSLGLIRWELAYITPIRLNIEYAAAIWDPDEAYIVNNIQSLQKRDVRFSFAHYSTFFSVAELRNITSPKARSSNTVPQTLSSWLASRWFPSGT